MLALLFCFIYLFKKKKEKHRKAVTCLSHALSHLAELSIDIRCSDNMISKLESHAIAHYFESHCQLLTTVLTQRSVFFCFMKCRSWIEWIKEDTRCCVVRMVLYCFKCICWEKPVIEKTRGQGSGVGRKFTLFTDSTKETKIVNSFPVWERLLAAPA